MALTTAQLLQKHLTSLRNADRRGRKPTGCVEQIAKYEALRVHVVKAEPTLWSKFCSANRVPSTHTAYNLFRLEA